MTMRKEPSRGRLEAIARLKSSMTAEELESADRRAHLNTQHCTMARDQIVAEQIKIMKQSLISIETDDFKNHRILFLVGESDSGKSACLRHVLPKMGLESYADEHGEAQPLLPVKMPTPCTIRNIAVECLRVLGVPVKSTIKESVVWPILRSQLVARRVVLIVFDEAQRMLKLDNENELQKVSDTLITLVEMEEWPLRMILSGVPQLETLRTRDDQMENRSQILRFGPVTPTNADKVEEWLLEVVTQHASLEIGDVPVADFSLRLIRACEGNVGSIISMIRVAAGITIGDGRAAMKASDFARAYHKKTACSPQSNLFSATN